jgi:ammonia channel protein AmtB
MDTGGLFTLYMNYSRVKIIHNTIHKMFIVFCTVKILHILYSYGLFYIRSPFFMYVIIFVTKENIYQHKISIDCTMHVYVFYSLYILNTVHDEPTLIAELDNKQKYC